MKRKFKNNIVFYLILITVGILNLLVSSKNLNKSLIAMWSILIVIMIILVIINVKKYRQSKDDEE